MNIVFLVVQQTMFFSIPLLIVALGGMFTERGGVTNIALDGMMIMGAFTSIFFINQMQGSMSGQTLLILAILIAVGTGMVFSLLLAYSAINMKSDQIIGGTALNMFAPAFAIYVARTLQDNGVQQITFTNTFRIPSVPLFGDIPILGGLLFKNSYITTYIGFAILVLAVIVLYKTKFGLRLRACGEHPQAADSVGINVYRMRYAGVVISGALAGLGGLVFVIPTSTNFNATVAGYGFLALAVMIFGQWKPGRIFFAALFFAIFKSMANIADSTFLAALQWPKEIYNMMPFIASMVILAFTSKKSRAPKAEGIPYDKSGR